MKLKFSILIIAAILVIATLYPGLVSAVGVGPGKVDISFSPNFHSTINFVALNNGDTIKEYRIYVTGELSKYVECDHTIITVQPRERYGFSCEIKLPSDLSPGVHNAMVGVIENVPPDSEGGIIVLSAVESRINVNVAYPAFYLAMTLQANNTKVNDYSYMLLDVRNWGKENVSLAVPIEIYNDKNEKVGSTITIEKNIESLKSATFKPKWLANVPMGKYTAIAKYSYGSQVFNASANFLVGDLYVNILNFTSNIPLNEIGRFDLLLESMWPEPINFETTVVVFNSSNDIIGTKKNNFTIGPWGSSNFNIFWDIPIAQPGD
jgi:hypothetical protein